MRRLVLGVVLRVMWRRMVERRMQRVLRVKECGRRDRETRECLGTNKTYQGLKEAPGKC